jgi:hypothetical protein
MNARQVSSHGSFGDGEAELLKLAVDPGGSPIEVHCRHAPDESPNLLVGPRPAASRPGTPTPVKTKAGTVPADDGVGFHDDEDLAPAEPQDPKCRPEESIPRVQCWPRPFAFEDRDLLAEGEDLKGRVPSTAEEDTDHGREREDEFGHEITLVTCRNVVSAPPTAREPKSLV